MLPATAPRPAAALSCRVGHLRPAARRPRPRAVAVKAWGGGYDKWKGEWDGSKLDPKLKDRLITYAELVQAIYDNLGVSGPGHVGDCKKTPATLLEEYDYDYSLVPKKYLKKGMVPPPDGKGTKDKYSVPLSGPDGLSAFIRALPGQGMPPKRPFSSDRVVDILCASVAGESMPVGRVNEATGGRGVVPVSAFIGYVATSPPNPKMGEEVEVVFVWRGTIFKEEWANNFAHDLALWDPENWVPKGEAGRKYFEPNKVSMHDGFADLYLRPCSQAGKTDEDALPDADKRPPRKVVHAWLAHLFENYRVTAVNTTGHSLGAALGTICAFDVGEEIDRIFRQITAPVPSTWATRSAPPVTCYSFACPRVGNYPFMKRFSDELQIRHLRVVNKPDVVPKVPGLWVQIPASLYECVGFNIYRDMDAWFVRAFAGIYTAYVTFNYYIALLPSKWGYFHTGQILEVDSDKDLDKVLDGTPAKKGSPHSLELHVHMLSRFGMPSAEFSARNFLLLNKADDIIGTDTDATRPAFWLGAPGQRGMGKDADGRWDYLGGAGTPAQAPAKAPADDKP